MNEKLSYVRQTMRNMLLHQVRFAYQYFNSFVPEQAKKVRYLGVYVSTNEATIEVCEHTLDYLKHTPLWVIVCEALFERLGVDTEQGKLKS